MDTNIPNVAMRTNRASLWLILFAIISSIVLWVSLSMLGGMPWHILAAGIAALLTIHCIILIIFFSKRKALIAAEHLENTDQTQTARLADSFNEALLTVSPRQKVIYLNKAARGLFPRVTMGQSLKTIIPHPGVSDMVDNVIEGRPAEPVIINMMTPVERHFRITGSLIDGPVPGDPTQRSRVILVLYDVTELERANTLRADFLANASHELKTPIASLLGYIETLNGHAKDDPEAQARFLDIMQQQAERMQRLIDDLLSLRRIEQTEHIAPTETADLFLATRAAKEAVAPMAKNKSVKIKYIGEKSLPVVGKQDELVQLVLNIVDNAVQMSPAGSQVVMESSVIRNWQPEEGFRSEPFDDDASRRRIINPPVIGTDYAILRIRDNGPGFTPQHLPRLSERFYRIAGDRTSKEKGTGLGLAIVKHITLRHRGGLLVETMSGKGTEFTLLLPLAPSDNIVERLQRN